MIKKVGILNYNSGNIRSIASAINYIGYETVMLNQKSDFKDIDYVILPGVGAFGNCVKKLKKSFIYNLLKKNELKRPLLGICVGFQLLFNRSDESPNQNGLSIFKEKFSKFPNSKNFKIPHVGWNEVKFKKNCNYFKKGYSYDFYFDHSYFLKNSKFSLCKSKHSVEFTSVVQRNNILACQFHPEKSQKNGLEFLKYFFNYYG